MLVQRITQQDYDRLDPKEPGTLYWIDPAAPPFPPRRAHGHRPAFGLVHQVEFDPDSPLNVTGFHAQHPREVRLRQLGLDEFELEVLTADGTDFRFIITGDAPVAVFKEKP